jgi:hypothetical protein
MFTMTGVSCIGALLGSEAATWEIATKAAKKT